ncbi:MAG: aspartate carbamoyltransferase regulatory subunit [Paludibacteraceae bacterium]|nr:aspartate carbamoyltransferase regulatory subunit [Prevotellaceae bacterium]
MEKDIKDKKELKVAALRNGTVIDHIPSDKLFKVISILKLSNCKCQMTFGFNLESHKLGKKGIIKVADKFLKQDEVNKVAVLAPNAKINIIKDYEVAEKKTLELPDEINGSIKCINPKCITNNEPMQSKFVTIDKEKGLFKCYYCERVVKSEDLIIE